MPPSTKVIRKLSTLINIKTIPLYVFFELTYKCNLSCKHCYVVKPTLKDLSKELTTPEIKDIISQLKEMNGLIITFTGGEVFLRPDILEILNYTKRQNFAIRIFTNGTLINKKIADEIKKIYPLEVGISLYSASSKVHDKITQVPGSFDKSLQAIKYLRERNIRVVIKCTLMKENIKDYPGVHHLAKSLGCYPQFDPTIVPKDNGDKSVLSLRIGKDKLKELFQDKNLFSPKRIIVKPLKRDFLCGAGKSLVNITPYGEVQPCLQFRINAGNLRNRSFADIWKNSLSLLNLRSLKETDLYICNSCSLQRFCSRCPGIAQLEDGDFLGKQTRACEIAEVKKELYQQRKILKEKRYA